MAGRASMRGDVDIDLMRLGAAIWERRFALVATVLAVGLLAFVISSAIAPLYRAETRILIEERQPVIMRDGQQQGARETVLDQQAIISQVEVIRSSDLLRQVIQQLELSSKPEFDAAARPSIVTDIRVFLGLVDDPLDESSMNRALKVFREKLQVYPVQNSRVIAIEFSSEDPELAADVANALASAYLEVQSGAKLASNAGAAAWLEPEIAAMRERVREAEARVAAFRSDSDLFLVAQNDTLSARQLSDISTELSQVRGERADAEARAANVRSALDEGRSTDTLSSVLQSPLIQRLREREVGIQSEIADLSTTLLDNHPRIRGLRSQLSDLEAQIRSEVSKALASLESDAAVARLREQELTGQLNAVKATSARAGEEEVELRALEREATAERELLETYLARYRETLSRGDPNALPADARVIARAVPPSEHYYPKTIPIVIVAMLATGLIYAIAIMLAELFSGRALRPTEAREETGAGVAHHEPHADEARVDEARADETERPVLAALPVSAMETHGTAEAAPMDEVVAPASPVAFMPQTTAPDLTDEDDGEGAGNDTVEPSDLRGPIEEDRPDVAPTMVAEDMEAADEDYSPLAVAAMVAARRDQLVACLSPEGDTASAGSVQLARHLADGDRRVLLIDMTATAAASRLMTETAGLPGITDLLSGDITIADAIHADRASAADIMPLGNADPQQAMRAASRITMIVEALGHAYECVVIECGPTRIEAVRRMVANHELAVVLAIVEPDEAMVTAELTALVEAGEEDAMLLLVDAPEDARNLSDTAA
jgi:exopolysaccharide transport family protein